jgi:predicted ATP-grasp superfamily ATP-dependent carboligase
VEELGGNSLRAGCVTQAAMKGVREFVIMRQTGHKTVTTLRRYIRSGEIFRETRLPASGSEREPTPGKIHFPGIGERTAKHRISSLLSKMVASALTGSVKIGDFRAAHDWHALVRCSRQRSQQIAPFSPRVIHGIKQ